MKKQLTQCIIALAICAYVPVSAAPSPTLRFDLKEFKKLLVAPKVASTQCGTVSNVIVITVVNCNELAGNNTPKDDKVIK